jgi:acetyl-CoA C-acetyltransferase
MSTGSLPAIVGAAQVVRRPDEWTDPADARGPIELMTAAARAAAQDAGAAVLLTKVDWIAVVGGLWSYRDPGRLIAARIGATQARTAKSVITGNASQDLIGVAAERIAHGEIEVALVVGGEAGATRRRLKAAGQEPARVDETDLNEPEKIGDFEPAMIAEIRALGVAATAYALLDDAHRIRSGDSMAAHRDQISELWARFSAVASRNPYAWDQIAHSATEIREPTSDNRMIAFPYPKAMVANNTVDQASAVILCSVDAARAVGIATDRLVFPHVVTFAHETWEAVNRHELDETPALAAAGHAALDHCGITVDDLDHIDLYACFPAIVRMSARALGLDLTRPLTITGGLGFAGAPMSNSSGQAIAAMVPLLRDGGWGLVHANGGIATKHAFGIYSAQPPERFARIDAQADAHLDPRPAAGPDWPGNGVVEAATVAFDREGPTYAVAAIRTPEGGRAFVRSTDADLMTAAMSDGLGGVTGPLPGATSIS